MSEHTAILRLSWPNTKLWPNRSRGRSHWYNQKEKKAAQQEGWGAASGQSIRKCTGRTVKVTFHPPTRRKFDQDNAIAAMKAAFDGISKAWGVDDSEWHLVPATGDVVKGGCVIVEIAPLTVDIPLVGEIS